MIVLFATSTISTLMLILKAEGELSYQAVQYNVAESGSIVVSCIFSFTWGVKVYLVVGCT